MRNRLVTWLAITGALLFALVLCAPALPAAPAAPEPAGSGAGHGLGMQLSRPDPSRKVDPRRLGTGLPMAASIDLSADAPPIGDQGAFQLCRLVHRLLRQELV